MFCEGWSDKVGRKKYLVRSSMNLKWWLKRLYIQKNCILNLNSITEIVNHICENFNRILTWVKWYEKLVKGVKKLTLTNIMRFTKQNKQKTIKTQTIQPIQHEAFIWEISETHGAISCCAHVANETNRNVTVLQSECNSRANGLPQRMAALIHWPPLYCENIFQWGLQKQIDLLKNLWMVIMKDNPNGEVI